MRTLLIVLAALVLVTGCTDATADDDRLTRAQERLEKAEQEARERLERARNEAREEIESARREAEEELARARERVDEARDRIGESTERARDEREAWSEEVRREAEDALEEAGLAETLGKVMEDVGLALQDEAEVEVMAERELRDLLPDRIAGAERYNTNSDESGFWGIRVGHVTGKYRGRSEGKLTLIVADLGTLRGLLTRSADWMDAGVRHESDNGWRRTTLIDGHPALLVKRESHSGRPRYEGTVAVANRFIVRVQAEGREFDEDIFEEAFGDVNLDQLARFARRDAR